MYNIIFTVSKISAKPHLLKTRKIRPKLKKKDKQQKPTSFVGIRKWVLRQLF